MSTEQQFPEPVLKYEYQSKIKMLSRKSKVIDSEGKEKPNMRYTIDPKTFSLTVAKQSKQVKLNYLMDECQELPYDISSNWDKTPQIETPVPASQTIPELNLKKIFARNMKNMDYQDFQ